MITSNQRERLLAAIKHQPTNPPMPHLTPAEIQMLRELVNAGREDDAWAEFSFIGQQTIGKAIETLMQKSKNESRDNVRNNWKVKEHEARIEAIASPIISQVAPATTHTTNNDSDALKGEDKVTSKWILLVQAEAAKHWQNLKGMKCSPTKRNIIDDLAKICREKEIKTDYGIYPSAQYIYRHVLRAWTPPID
jgi:hypothetical protein